MKDEIIVLHIDDEPGFSDMVAQFLRRENDRFSVETAQDGKGALDLIENRSVDCVVSDYEMPGRNGIELLEEVRKQVPDLPFILYTGKGSEEIAGEAISAGVTDYLQKGTGTDQFVILSNRIQNAVEKVRAERSAEDALGLYQSLMEDALDTSEVGTAILDSNFDIVWINSAIESFFDIERNEVIGENKRTLIESHIASIFEAPEEFSDRVTATYADNTYIEEFESFIPGGDSGRDRWLRHWSQPIQNGRFAGGRIEHYTDITEFKEREQEIARLNEFHSTVLANIRDTVLITDETGRFTYICPNVEFIFGYNRDQMADIGTIEGLLGDRLVELEELAEQGEIHNIETTVEDQDGEDLKLLVSVTAVDVEEGSQLYSMRDITNRIDRQQRLKEKNERLDEFASLVSHDLQNPLSVAMGRLEIYRETGDASHLDQLEQSLMRVEELIIDLTTLSRHGTLADEHESISLPDIVNETWDLIDTRSATLSTEQCTVIGHRSQLKTLFENLFRNAVGHGGPDVTVRVGPIDNGFYVEDTGNGIPLAERDRVFEHGFTTGYSGSGIGLTIVSRIAQAHNWGVSLNESAEGGARFEFRGIAGDT